MTADGYEQVDEAEVAERFAWRSSTAAAEVTGMSMPYYVAPEQVMKDRAEYAQKGIARGRSLVATVYADGVLIVAENPSRSLHKISEIYDRIAFAGVGKYNEFDQLRVAGIRHADTKGFAFSREDVDARSLANLYAQYLGHVFTHEMKPLEVEILVAELGADGRPNQLYHVAYEGTITDEDRFAVLGGDAQTISERVGTRLAAGPAAGRRRSAGRRRPRRTGADARVRGPRSGRAQSEQRPPHVPAGHRRRAGLPPVGRGGDSDVGAVRAAEVRERGDSGQRRRPTPGRPTRRPAEGTRLP